MFFLSDLKSSLLSFVGRKYLDLKGICIGLPDLASKTKQTTQDAQFNLNFR